MENRCIRLADLEHPEFKATVCEFRDLWHNLRRLGARGEIDGGFEPPAAKVWDYWFTTRNCGIWQKPGAKILDVGCWMGMFPAWLATKGYDVTATDIGEMTTIEGQAKALNVKIRTISVPAENEDTFDACEFDYIFSLSVLEHIRRPGYDGDIVALHNMRRWVRDDGMVVLTIDLGVGDYAGQPGAWAYRKDDIRRLLNCAGLAAIGPLDFAVEWIHSHAPVTSMALFLRKKVDWQKFWVFRNGKISRPRKKSGRPRKKEGG